MQPNELTALEAISAIEAGNLTVEALMSACLDRIEEREPEIAAWAYLDRANLLSAARWHEGKPPMRGVPVALEDVIDTTDAPTTYGSFIYRNYWPTTDAACVTRVEEANGLILGKTHTSEFSGSYPGPTRNPHDVRHTPGGSGGGAAAAVADHMVPLAIGRQAGGALIRPAAHCGIYGYKPTYGLLSLSGVHHLAESLDTLGCFTRSIEDIAFLLDILLGGRPAPMQEFEGRPRIALCRTHHWDEADETTRACIERAARRLIGAGMTMKEVELPRGFDFESSLEVFAMVYEFETARNCPPGAGIAAEQMSSLLRDMCDRGMAIEAAEYRGAVQRLHQWRGLVEAKFTEFDAVLTPCAHGEAPLGIAAPGKYTFNYLWTALHMPALTIPAFSGPQGLPIGVQLVAPCHTDERFLSVAREIARHIID